MRLKVSTHPPLLLNIWCRVQITKAVDISLVPSPGSLLPYKLQIKGKCRGAHAMRS